MSILVHAILAWLCLGAALGLFTTLAIASLAAWARARRQNRRAHQLGRWLKFHADQRN
jgi:Flp pilus assembly protein TadB